MIEGQSGIMSLYVGAPSDSIPDYQPSVRRIVWPNGAIASTYSAEEPDRLRNKQHDGGWCDELAAWDDAQATWDQYQFGLRLGDRPQTVATTTPRPLSTSIRALSKDPRVAVTRGSTFDNRINLAPSFLHAITKAYEGTRLGRQEIYAEILEDNPGALWKLAAIDAKRVKNAPVDFPSHRRRDRPGGQHRGPISDAERDHHLRRYRGLPLQGWRSGTPRLHHRGRLRHLFSGPVGSAGGGALPLPPVRPHHRRDQQRWGPRRGDAPDARRRG